MRSADAKMKIGLLILAATGLLVCCAPILSDRAVREANLTVTFPQLQKDPDAYKGKRVILGGKIIATTVKKGETWLEILQQPLDNRYRPENTDVSFGRFFVVLPGFVDPAIYASGRRISVSGDVSGKLIGPIQNLHYVYPVLSAREHMLIKQEDYVPNPPRIYFSGGVNIVR